MSMDWAHHQAKAVSNKRYQIQATRLHCLIACCQGVEPENINKRWYVGPETA